MKLKTIRDNVGNLCHYENENGNKFYCPRMLAYNLKISIRDLRKKIDSMCVPEFRTYESPSGKTVNSAMLSEYDKNKLVDYYTKVE